MTTSDQSDVNKCKRDEFLLLQKVKKAEAETKLHLKNLYKANEEISRLQADTQNCKAQYSELDSEYIKTLEKMVVLESDLEYTKQKRENILSEILSEKKVEMQKKEAVVKEAHQKVVHDREQFCEAVQRFTEWWGPIDQIQSRRILLDKSSTQQSTYSVTPTGGENIDTDELQSLQAEVESLKCKRSEVEKKAKATEAEKNRIQNFLNNDPEYCRNKLEWEQLQAELKSKSDECRLLEEKLSEFGSVLQESSPGSTPDEWSARKEKTCTDVSQYGWKLSPSTKDFKNESPAPEIAGPGYCLEMSPENRADAISPQRMKTGTFRPKTPSGLQLRSLSKRRRYDELEKQLSDILCNKTKQTSTMDGKF